MTKKELTDYCERKNIRKEHINEIKESGIMRSDAILKVLEDELVTIGQISRLVEQAERMKNAYFYTPPQFADMRRRYEANNSVDEFEWNDGSDVFTASYKVSCSCKNVYAKGYYTKNNKKTNLRAVKCSLSKLKDKLFID